MLDKEFTQKRHNAKATVYGDWNKLYLAYEDRFIGRISATFSPANAKYSVLTGKTEEDSGEVIKFIKEQILHAKN